MTHGTKPLSPPDRLLAGPGPSNVSASVLEAMQKPQIGHLDPAFWDICGEVVSLLQQAYRRRDGLSFPISASGTSGIEAVLTGLLAPGETAIVGVAGFFGARVAEIARRLGAEVVAVEVPWGEVVPNERILAALDDQPQARIGAVVCTACCAHWPAICATVGAGWVMP